jgi:hypothetical protein
MLSFERLSGSEGIWEASFDAPSTESFLLISAMQNQIGFSNTTLNVRPVKINHLNSSITCPNNAVVAGTEISCLMKIVDENMTATGGESLSSSFTIVVKDGGLRIRSEISYIADPSIASTGMYNIFMTPTSIHGLTTVKVVYQMGEKQVIIGPVQKQTQDITVVAGEVDLIKSKLGCPKIAMAGVSFLCEITVRDAFNNKAGSLEQLGLFEPEASTTINGKAFVQAPNNVHRNSQSKSVFVNFTLNKASMWIIDASFDAVKLGQHNPQVIISPREANYSKTTLQCPEKVVSSAKVTCFVFTYDEYSNPTFDAIFTARTAFTRIGSQSSVGYPSVRRSQQVGTWNVQFSTKSIPGNYTVKLVVGGTEVRSASFESTPLDIDFRQSDVTCTKSVTAGMYADCIIKVFANGVPVGDAMLADAFDNLVTNVDIVLSPPAMIVRQGVFKVSFLPLRSSGAAYFQTRYMTSNGEKMIGTTQQITVIAADPHPDYILSFCGDITYAGWKVQCAVLLYDQFWNVAGDDSFVSKISGRASHEIESIPTIVPSLPLTWERGKESYDIKMEYLLTDAGSWTIQNLLRNGNTYTSTGKAPQNLDPRKCPFWHLLSTPQHHL